MHVIRGGVEDTRLEARPRHKKNPRPRTALPRTDPLEAKGRNVRGQGPRAQRGSDLQKKPSKKKEKLFNPKLRKFSGIFRRSPEKKKDLRFLLQKFKRSPRMNLSSKFFSQACWRSSRRNKIVHDLGPFSTSQKIVLSLSRGQGIFENLQTSIPRT